MSKRLNAKDRKTMLEAWKAGKESEVKEKGYYVMKNKKGVENVRKYKQTSSTPEKPKEEVPVKKVRKEDKENIL
jgi:hypothetical protein